MLHTEFVDMLMIYL